MLTCRTDQIHGEFGGSSPNTSERGRERNKGLKKGKFTENMAEMELKKESWVAAPLT